MFFLDFQTSIEISAARLVNTGSPAYTDTSHLGGNCVHIEINLLNRAPIARNTNATIVWLLNI